jgi:two-component system, OmpR family, response regulator
MARILLVEDDERLGAFIEKGVRQQGHVVEWVRDGRSGLERLLAGSCEVAIVDVMLPELDGVELVTRARLRQCATPVIMLSARAEVGHRVKGLQAGADDYLGKPFSFAELIARLDALLRRADSQRAVKTELAFHDLELNLLTRRVRRSGAEIELQPKEYALLEYFMRNPERVLSKTMILEHIWDYRFDPQTNVVDVLVSRLRQKVDREHKDKLIHTIRGVGYVLRRA